MRAQTGQRESIYRIVAVEEGRELKAALSDTLGIETIVAKERRLFLWRGVRIHLDEVEDPGRLIRPRVAQKWTDANRPAKATRIPANVTTSDC